MMFFISIAFGQPEAMNQKILILSRLLVLVQISALTRLMVCG